jgi:hypothetical protein
MEALSNCHPDENQDLCPHANAETPSDSANHHSTPEKLA